MVIVAVAPSHLPLEKPAFFMYAAARLGSPVRVLDEVEVRALRARGSAGLLEPGNSGRDVVRRDRPDSSPPRVFAQRRRGPSSAITALRTLMSSNGGFVVLSATYRLPPLGVSVSWSGYLVAACLSASGSELKSPLTWALPVRIFLPAETVSREALLDVDLVQVRGTVVGRSDPSSGCDPG